MWIRYFAANARTKKLEANKTAGGIKDDYDYVTDKNTLQQTKNVPVS